MFLYFKDDNLIYIVEVGKKYSHKIGKYFFGYLADVVLQTRFLKILHKSQTLETIIFQNIESQVTFFQHSNVEVNFMLLGWEGFRVVVLVGGFRDTWSLWFHWWWWKYEEVNFL